MSSEYRDWVLGACAVLILATVWLAAAPWVKRKEDDE